ncbi:hypothetical protein [Paramicrobacterium chengjingii]|uniref:hypothetical protein n=1 Tax=Paramicrobacterium chengjingii TaxID=2769067 RepID=UPI001422E01F|nr:hypothetical protein [Microbacterium chengjingii]
MRCLWLATECTWSDPPLLFVIVIWAFTAPLMTDVELFLGQEKISVPPIVAQ